METELNNEQVLVKKVLSEQIKEQLIKDLMNKKYKAGDKLVESALAKRFGVSQAPVREAMKGLLEMGLVTVEPYKGTTVRTMTKEDLWETFTVRAALESLAAGMAAMKITTEQVAQLEALVDEMIEAAEAGDVLKRSEINNRFHDEIIKISGHKLIIKLSNTLKFGSWSLTTGTLTSMNSVEIARRHKKIIEPLKNHDSDGATKAMREHIEHSVESMLENWKAE